MSDIVLSAGVRQNLLALQNTADLMTITQKRLATGKKVNSALDNPVNFFTASALQSRAGDLNGLLDAMSNGIKTIEAADNGVKAIKNTIESMQATLRQARQDASWKSTSYTIDTATIGTAAAKNLTFSGGTVGAPVNVALNTPGAGGTQATVATAVAYTAPAAAAKAQYTAAGNYTTPTQNEPLTIAFGTSSVSVTLTTSETTLTEAIDKINAAILLDADSNGVIQAVAAGSALRIETVNDADGLIGITGTGEGNIFGAETSTAGSDGQYQLTVSGTAVTLTSGDSPTLATAINTANLQLQAAASAFEAYDAGGGALGFREIVAQGTTLTIGGVDAALFGAVVPGTPGTGGSVQTVEQLVTAINAALTGKVQASNDNGKLRIMNLSTTDLDLVGVSAGGAIDGDVGTAIIGGNTVRRNLVNQYNELRAQLDKLSDDASFNGINLLRGDKLTITFNEAGTSSIVIQAKDENGNPTAVNAGTLAIVALTTADVDADTTIDTRLGELTISLVTLRSHASNFGSNLFVVQNRTEFTKRMINTLETGADTLVLADTNEEGANMLALQTRQQLSTTALSLASQADQAVLRLFG